MMGNLYRKNSAARTERVKGADFLWDEGMLNYCLVRSRVGLNQDFSV